MQPIAIAVRSIMQLKGFALFLIMPWGSVTLNNDVAINNGSGGNRPLYNNCSYNNDPVGNRSCVLVRSQPECARGVVLKIWGIFC